MSGIVDYKAIMVESLQDATNIVVDNSQCFDCKLGEDIATAILASKLFEARTKPSNERIEKLELTVKAILEGIERETKYMREALKKL